VVLSLDRGQGMGLLRQLLVTALTAAPFALAGVMLAAAAVVGIGLRPLRRLSHAVSRVTARQLDEPIDPARLPRELVELAMTFNAMLDRLRDSVTRLSEFSADLAHEMRTPLATLLARTQVVLSQQRKSEELSEVLVQNVEELQRLSRLVTDMLFLAQADKATHALQLEQFDLASEAQRVTEFLAIGAEDKELRFDVRGTGRVLADRGLVQRALTNLISNAVRHARRDSVIVVEVESRTAGASVSVENEGDDIPKAHLGRLFERFYRADPARHREGGGAGLGLSIVQAIMTLHGGSAAVSMPAAGRVRFTLLFPVSGKSARVSAQGPIAAKV
jgi:two-component system heavy metal sensor histidine kinase CusS